MQIKVAQLLWTKIMESLAFWNTDTDDYDEFKLEFNAWCYSSDHEP